MDKWGASIPISYDELVELYELTEDGYTIIVLEKLERLMLESRLLALHSDDMADDDDDDDDWQWADPLDDDDAYGDTLDRAYPEG